MHDEIRKQIEKRISASPRFSVERIADGEIYDEQGTSRIAAHTTSILEHQMNEMFDEADASEAAAQIHETAVKFGGFPSQRQLEKHLIERTMMAIGSPKQAFDFTIPFGSRVFAPPYDRD